MSETVRELIDALADTDYSVAQNAFNTAITDKMRDAIDSARIEVASKIYNDESEEEYSDEEVE